MPNLAMSFGVSKTFGPFLYKNHKDQISNDLFVNDGYAEFTADHDKIQSL